MNRMVRIVLAFIVAIVSFCVFDIIFAFFKFDFNTTFGLIIGIGTMAICGTLGWILYRKPLKKRETLDSVFYAIYLVLVMVLFWIYIFRYSWRVEAFIHRHF